MQESAVSKKNGIFIINCRVYPMLEIINTNINNNCGDLIIFFKARNRICTSNRHGRNHIVRYKMMVFSFNISISESVFNRPLYIFFSVIELRQILSKNKHITKNM